MSRWSVAAREHLPLTTRMMAALPTMFSVSLPSSATGVVVVVRLSSSRRPGGGRSRLCVGELHGRRDLAGNIAELDGRGLCMVDRWRKDGDHV